MSASLPDAQPPALPGGTGPVDPWPGRYFHRWFALRGSIPRWQVALFGVLCLVLCLALWWFVTRGEAEERILPPSKGLPSPAETFGSFRELWFDRELTRNLFVTLRRLVLGFGLATVIGVPLGVLCGCFPRLNAFFLPLSIFGRNIPIAALIPLTFSLFGIGETQKVLFIFLACVAFILSDTARAIADVGEQYVDTAYTLGASRLQIITRVLVPLALPSVFNSLRLLFGLAFGYIMLAESIKLGAEAGGLGDIIITSQKRGLREHIILVLLIIPIVALLIDRILFWVQKELFPHRYGGAGLLSRALQRLAHLWEDLKFVFIRSADVPDPAPASGVAA